MAVHSIVDKNREWVDHQADLAGHTVMMTALTIAIAKHHVRQMSEEQSQEFFTHFAVVSAKMAASYASVPVKERAEHHTNKMIAALLQAKNRGPNDLADYGD